MNTAAHESNTPFADQPASQAGRERTTHPTMGPIPRATRASAWLVAIGAAALMLIAGTLGTTSVISAAAGDQPTVVVNGRGWGHGRGMSQYGAQGYATDFGWSSAQILDHYYGGTTGGQAPSPGAVDPARVRVDLVSMRGRSTTVSLDSGTLHLMASDGTTLRRVTGAVRLNTSGGSMSIEVAPSCDGPWTNDGTIDRGLVRIAAETAASDQSGLLQLCGPSYRTWYGGELWATSTGSSQRTINLVSIEEYLRGVVPNEMPASWDSVALEVQAVAARSYALAGDTRWSGYADTCDTTTCQVYDGRFTTRGSGWRQATHERTDAAIAATAGLVRLTGSGAVARTEFSSSTGGYTAGGDFPAVLDEGDAVSINPNHQWQTTVDLESVENSAGLGALRGVTVSESNGLGVAGGRAVTVTYVFADGSLDVDGDTFRRQFGLKSNWFSFGSFSRGGVAQPSVDDTSIDLFVDQAFERLQGREPTAEEMAQWRTNLRTGSRISLAEQLVRSEFFAGVLVDDLYVAALGRSADGDGRNYWVSTMADGLKYEHMGTLFYGSPEYVRRSGDNNDAFVSSLYVNILGRQPDADGKAYWVGLLDTGQAEPADVANAFYRSIESRRDRARALHLRVIASEPDAAAVETYAERLLAIDDLAVAAELAASPAFTAGAG